MRKKLKDKIRTFQVSQIFRFQFLQNILYFVDSFYLFIYFEYLDVQVAHETEPQTEVSSYTRNLSELLKVKNKDIVNREGLDVNVHFSQLSCCTLQQTNTCLK